VFGNLLVDLCQFQLGFSIVIDCDGTDLGYLSDQFSGHSGSRYGSAISIEMGSVHLSTSDMDIVDFEISSESGITGPFTVVAFSESLEKAAGVDKNNSREVIEATISDYATEVVSKANMDQLLFK
jgi:hypothetical protein